MRVVTLVGGTGFVGRYTAQAFVAAGWRVRVASRTPEAILVLGDREGDDAFVKVEPMVVDIRTGDGLAAAVADADAVVNLVGILAPGGGQTFDGVQAKGSRRVAEAAKAADVPRFIQVSAIGADADSPANYAQTKAAGEAAVLEHFPDAAILRPSIVFGPEDQFFNRFAGMAQISPMIPVVGAETKFQPVYVRDVAKAVVAAAEGDAAGVVELGGPKTYSFAELMTLMLKVIERKRPLFKLPFWIAKLQGRAFDLIPLLTFGALPNGVLTLDQVQMLQSDNVVSAGKDGMAALGLTPTAVEDVIPSYLAAYRP